MVRDFVLVRLTLKVFDITGTRKKKLEMRYGESGMHYRPGMGGPQIFSQVTRKSWLMTHRHIYIYIYIY